MQKTIGSSDLPFGTLSKWFGAESGNPLTHTSDHDAESGILVFDVGVKAFRDSVG